MFVFKKICLNKIINGTLEINRKTSTVLLWGSWRRGWGFLKAGYLRLTRCWYRYQ
jgi:hypothetical protein